MEKYKVSGLYTISFEMEIEAEDREEAEDKGYNLYLAKDYSGNIVTNNVTRLILNGEPFNIKVKKI